MERLVNASELAIDPEFRDYLHPWSDTKRSEMERQLLRDGRPEHPVIVWKGTSIVVEGQNRFGICAKHGLKVPMVEREFKDRAAVKAFMRERHLANDRGSTPSENAVIWAEHMDYLRGTGVKNAAEQVAAAAGVDRRTVFRAVNYADAIASLPPDLRIRITSGDIKAGRDVVIELAGYGELHQRNIISELDRGEYQSLAAAMRCEGNEDSGDEGDDMPFDSPSEVTGSDSDAAESDTASPREPAPAAADPVGDPIPPPPPHERKPKDDSKPKPSRKPIKEMFNEAQRQLSKVSLILDKARGVKRMELDYKECMAHLKALSDSIETWSDR